ncbi:MAG: glycine cleavage system aminomethyltransferase GcvT, partial [Candidatus Aminicenantes bacterium]|nr:glycine cleavage system aminomethyltransferase GcvT [Candidatus Aminicenantes bacterium]
MKKTRLHSCHEKLDAKMIEFFGWHLPVEYSGIMEEHMAVRQKAGLFDVSHMGEIIVRGEQALDLVQYLTPNNAAKLGPGKAQYSALTTPKGTFIDDLLVYFLNDQEYLLVVNASNVEKDHAWILGHAEHFDVTVENKSAEYSQMALQGPAAEKILRGLTDVAIEELKAFQYKMGQVAGEEALVSR